jgi:hypothetical protein
VLAKFASDSLRDYRAALGGTLAPRGTAAASPLAFTPWLGTLLRAGWEGEVVYPATPAAGAAPSPWRLSLQRAAPAPAGPIAPAALDDVEVLVRYRLG